MVKRRVTRRRALVGGMGAASLTTTGVMVYRAAPRFWHQYVREWKRPIDEPANVPNPRSWPDTGIHAAWLGHATTLIKIDGFTILTDPVFSDRAGIHLGPMTLGVKRVVAAALKAPNIPRPDLILLSHAHMDHFDIRSLRSLEDLRTSVVTAWRTADLLRPKHYQRVHQLRWGDSVQVGPARITAFEVNHWGARMRTDTYRGYNGYTIECHGRRLMFAGDTADTYLFKPLRSSKRFDLAVMPIGAYNPWIHYHCTPEQAWRMGEDAGAEHMMPVHHQTFVLSSEPMGEPIERFYAAAGSSPDRVALDSIGQEFHLS